MKKTLDEALEFFSFLVLMAILGFGAIMYSMFVLFYWIYAKVTRQEHLIK